MDVFSWGKGPIAAQHVVTELGGKKRMEREDTGEGMGRGGPGGKG